MVSSLTQKHPEILFANQDNTVIVIDIPYSIACAQNITPPDSASPDFDESVNLINRVPYSTEPIEAPYPSTEPKSAAARQKLEQQLSADDLEHHRRYASVLEKALEDGKEGMNCGGKRDFCMPRIVMPATKDVAYTTSSKKRKRKRGTRGDHVSIEFDNGQCFNPGNDTRSPRLVYRGHLQPLI